MRLDWFADALDLGERWPGYGAMALRAVIVFVLVLAFVRFGARRFIAKLSSIDMLVAIMIGSISSRAITGNSTFGPAILSIAVLIALHWVFSAVCFHTPRVGPWLKGDARHLIKDSEPVDGAMSRSKITRRDLLEAARSNGIGRDLDDVQDAWLERDGSISVLGKKTKG